MGRLPRHFFQRHVVEVAQDLLGKQLVFGGHTGIIVETEAYRGEEDAASHAFRGPTPRTQVMFGLPGVSYVYFIYGMYHCLNIVAEEEGTAGAVLIRGLYDPQGLQKLDGPGKICRSFGITRQHNALDLVTHPSFYIAEAPCAFTMQATPRIGIRVATDLLWRFTAQVQVNAS